MRRLALEAITAPLDVGRAALLRRFGGTLRPLIADRGARTAVIFTAVVLFAFTATLTMPVALLALGPIVLGVPHVLADVRYLVVRPGFHRVHRLWPIALPLLGVCTTSDLRVGLLAPLLAALLARGALARRALVVALAALGCRRARRFGRLGGRLCARGRRGSLQLGGIAAVHWR